MNKIAVPEDYDYVGVYLTNKCHLNCSYCLTGHNGSLFRQQEIKNLSPDEWIAGLNKFVLPRDVPITLQGGEPFLYAGIWKILENLNHKVDILTALPQFLKKEHFLKLKNLDWNKRKAPYPTIRVSYHKGQNNYKELIERIAVLQDILSIGLYYLDHPSITEEEIAKIREYAKKYDVELRMKDFLGDFNGKLYGNFSYKDACLGEKKGIKVHCRNTVVPIAPDGTIYRCHSDLYFGRKEKAIGNITEENIIFPNEHLPCENYGLCNSCDVKIKNNHYQIFGYTSANIKLPSSLL